MTEETLDRLRAERDEAVAYAVNEREAAHARELALLAERDRLRALLRKVEWSAVDGTLHECCPICRMFQIYGHDADCRLAKALEGRDGT